MRSASLDEVQLSVEKSSARGCATSQTGSWRAWAAATAYLRIRVAS